MRENAMTNPTDGFNVQSFLETAGIGRKVVKLKAKGQTSYLFARKFG
jgi:hypothetical protein